jgi:hypothetical protein
MNTIVLGFKWGYIKKFHPTIPNSFTRMKSHELCSKAYWMIIKELCKRLTTLMFLNPTM